MASEEKEEEEEEKEDEPLRRMHNPVDELNLSSFFGLKGVFSPTRGI